MLAYVEGRPIPSSSRRLTRVASVNRGGGSVKCCLGRTSSHRTVSPLATLGKAALVGLVPDALGRVVAALLIQLEEAVEQNDGTGGAQTGPAVACRHVDGGLLETRRSHLARHRPLPDQVIEAPGLIVEER